jgi:HEAT repeat protein
MDIHFCDLCNESVPQADLDLGRAFIRRGRVVCAKCESAMTHSEGSTPLRAGESGGVALQAEVATALGALTEEPFLSPGSELHVISEPLPGETAQATAPSPSGGIGLSAAAAGTIPAPVPAAAPGRSSGVVLAMIALVFAAGAVAILNEQIGGVGSRTAQVEASLRSQEAALRALQKTNAETRDAITALESRLGESLSSQRESADKSLQDLRAQNEVLRKAGVDLGQRIDELRDTSQSKGQDIDRRNDEISHRLAKGEDDNRALQERLAKLEESAQHAPAPAAAPAAAASGAGASRWSGLVADLQSPKAATRWQAVDQIGQSGDPEAVPYLLPLLKDSDVFVRMATARVLGDLKATAAVPALIDSLEDVEPAVREAALGSLRALTGKDLRFDPMASESDRAKKVKAWRDWWKKVEEEGGVGKGQG